MHDNEVGSSGSANDAEHEQQDTTRQRLTADPEREIANDNSTHNQDHADNYPEVGVPTMSLWQRFMNWRNDPYRQKAHWSDLATIGLTITLVGVGITQACIYYQQKKIMEASGGQTDQLIDAAEVQARASRRIALAARIQARAASRFSDSAEEINDATKIAVNEFDRIAKAAEGSVKSTLDIARLEQRPWIAVGLNIPALDIDKVPPPANAQVTNSGKTFAKNVVFTSYMHFSPDVPTTLPTYVPDHTVKSVAVLAPNFPYTSPLEWPSTTLKLKDIISPLPITNDWYFVDWGTVTYDDVFHPPGKHTTKFCGYRKLSDPSAPLQCPFGNDAD